MKTNIMEIDGTWESGLVLDWHTAHSEYIGDNQFGRPQFETTRTEVGESLFLLKYRDDLTKTKGLAQTMSNAVTSFFPSVSLIVPMPPSKSRETQPLLILAQKVAEILNIPFFENILIKDDTTSQMKDIDSRQKKVEELMDCFNINNGISNDGAWDVLIIDDLYSTGASLSAATNMMKTYTKVKKVYVAAFSRTK